MRLSAFCALFALTIAMAAPVVARAADFEDPPSELASVLVKKAKRAEKAGDLAEAYVYYSQASALQPRNRGYRSAAAALQVRGAAQIKTASAPPIAAPAAVGPGVDTDPVIRHASPPADALPDSLTARELAREPQLASPPALNAGPGRFDFDLSDTPRNLFDKIATRFNLQVVFDSDYPPAGQPVRFRITQVGYREALEALQAATGSFVVPVSSRVIMVARDTAAKRNDLEQYVTLTVPVPQVVTSQELTEIIQLVRQVSSVEKMGWDTNDDEIVMRDRVSRVALAQDVLTQLFSYHPEVMIDMELLQVSDSDMINYGFTVTNSFPLVYLGGIQNSVASIPSGVTNLLTFGAGRTLIGVAAAEVQAMFNETFSNSKALYSARLRSSSGQAGVFHVGEKYPIITSGFVAASTTNTTGSTSPTYAAPPAISFENLGLELKATPHVHGADAVSMAIEASYEVLSGQSADGIPVIESNKITTDIRLRNEEWAVVAGLIGDTKTKSKSGFWGLENIPFIGNLFKQTSIDKESTNLLIGIRPHILSIGPDENVTRPLRTGSDTRPYTPL
jgi:type II secretory pathway component GspD/PulD (secretin)